MTKEDIRKLIGRDECTELEYKSAKGGFPESFWAMVKKLGVALTSSRKAGMIISGPPQS